MSWGCWLSRQKRAQESRNKEQKANWPFLRGTLWSSDKGTSLLFWLGLTRIACFLENWSISKFGLITEHLTQVTPFWFKSVLPGPRAGGWSPKMASHALCLIWDFLLHFWSPALAAFPWHLHSAGALILPIPGPQTAPHSPPLLKGNKLAFLIIVIPQRGCPAHKGNRLCHDSAELFHPDDVKIPF